MSTGPRIDTTPQSDSERLKLIASSLESFPVAELEAAASRLAEVKDPRGAYLAATAAGLIAWARAFAVEGDAVNARAERP